MAFFSKKEDKKPSTLEEVRKAYEDLSDDDKKSFHQSIADRVHESVAAQEREHGQEDSQSAAAREHEALGAEHADDEGNVDELHEKDDTSEEESEDKADEKKEEAEEEHNESHEDVKSTLKALQEDVAKLAMRLDLIERTPQKADDAAVAKLSAIENLYNN